MKKCWDLDLLKRPTMSELKIIIENWKNKFRSIRYNDYMYEIADKEIRKCLETIRDEQLIKDMEELEGR